MLNFAILVGLLASPTVAAQDATEEIVFETGPQVLADIDSCLDSRSAPGPDFGKIEGEGWKSTEGLGGRAVFQRGLAKLTFAKVDSPSGISCAVQVPMAFMSFMDLTHLLEQRFKSEASLAKDRTVFWRRPGYDVLLKFHGEDPQKFFAQAEVIYPISGG